MQIPILAGIYTDNAPALRTSYPVNLQPVPKTQALGTEFLKPADGIIALGTGPGINRGAIEWSGDHYRVMGSQLCRIDTAGTLTDLGSVTIGSGNRVSMDYSFSRLAIASNQRLYYYDGTTLDQVTDPDLGVVLDVIWIDGYFMVTDGDTIVVTELNDPFAVNPLKYGSSEVDPDPIVALKKLRNEAYAINRHSIEVFENVGGEGFPFSRIDGAFIPRGSISTSTCCVYADAIAFIGGARNESPSVWLGLNGKTQKISTQELDTVLLQYSESVLAESVLETRNDKSHSLLYVHLPDRTYVYDANASQELGEPVWHILVSTLDGFAQYRARDFIWSSNRWNCANTQTNQYGYLADQTGQHWGSRVRWEFGTTILYNEGAKAIIHQMELVALTGRIAVGTEPRITTSYSVDGRDWSQRLAIVAGTTGATTKRLVWFQQGLIINWRVQRFEGDSDSHISFARLEASIEKLTN